VPGLPADAASRATTTPSLSFTARRTDTKEAYGNTMEPSGRCPVCSLGWVGPGPGDSVVLCILTRHIVETHPNTAHATTLRFNAEQLGGSASPDDWCQHDPEQHRRIMVLEPTF
jgi:hypothetical protein